jgi:S-adenosylmethionine hydrolase
MVIALLTDFGNRDGFVGAMKGVILTINPGAKLVDISHEVEPFSVLEGALLLRAHYSYFPRGTVFVAVVDPGVGSERRPIALRCGGYFFVGPDNGIFDLVIKDLGSEPEVVLIEREEFLIPRRNETFHGRDIFSPVAAHLSRGVPLTDFGSRTEYLFRLRFPEPEVSGDKVVGEIIYFDRFGNGVTNVPCGAYRFGFFRGERLKVVPFFQAGEKGRLNITCGSFGLMELFTPMADAKDSFGLRLGEKVLFNL